MRLGGPILDSEAAVEREASCFCRVSNSDSSSVQKQLHSVFFLGLPFRPEDVCDIFFSNVG
jgi:hypothetical protein